MFLPPPPTHSFLQLSISSAMIRLPLFFENNYGQKASILGQGVMYGPGMPNARSTQVAVQDVGEVSSIPPFLSLVSSPLLPLLSVPRPSLPTRPDTTAASTSSSPRAIAMRKSHRPSQMRSRSRSSTLPHQVSTNLTWILCVYLQIRYQQVPYEQARQSFLGMGMPAWQVCWCALYFSMCDL